MEADTLRESQHNIIARSLSIAKQLGDDNLESTDLSTSAEGPKLDTSARSFPKHSTDENDVIRNGPASLHSRNDIISLSRSSSVLSLADSTFSLSSSRSMLVALLSSRRPRI